MTTDTTCPTCGKPAHITQQEYNNEGAMLVERALLIEGCDCLKVTLHGDVALILRRPQELQYHYERDVRDSLPSYFRQMAQAGKPVCFSRQDFIRRVDEERERLGL